MILCSQYRHKGWYDQLGGRASSLAGAVLDRGSFMLHIKLGSKGLIPQKSFLKNVNSPLTVSILLQDSIAISLYLGGRHRFDMLTV